jgi:tetratricopeptide (TPR) repeat protein
MEITHNWLDEINDHHDDREWLQVHIIEVYDGIRNALYKPYLLNLGVDTLVNICPFLLTTYDIKPWLMILFHAMTEMMTVHDNERLMHIWWRMGEGQLVAGNTRMASSAFTSALKRARESEALRLMMDAYINSFRVQALRCDGKFDTNMIDEAVSLSRQLNEPELEARLYHAIAVAYRSRGEAKSAFGYGQMAFACWHKLGNAHEMADVAFTLAVICRSVGLIQPALRYLDLSKDLFLKVNDLRQYALIAYEEGSLCRQLGDFEGAVQWRKIALAEFSRLEPPHCQPYYSALANHALGNAYVELKQYEEGRASLRNALSLWEELDNKYEQASVWLTLGYMEGQKQNIQRANKYLNRAQNLCKKIPDMNSRRSLERLIEESFAELP